ncbi:MAG: acyl-CoA thioesterase [Bacilli bacterium]
MKVEKQIEVRYAETDAMGIVHHASYIVWFELGRVSLLDTYGLRLGEIEENGYYVPVLDIAVKYHATTTFGDDITITTELQKYDGISFVYAYEIRKANNSILCVSGSSKHCLVKKDSFRPIRIPRTYPELHQKLTNPIEK